MINALRSVIPISPNAGGGFIALVRQSEARKREAEVRLRFYQDRQSDDLLSLIRKRWSEPETFRLFCINIVRKIVNRKAMVYKAAPVRSFKGWEQERGESLYRAIGANTVLKKANRLTKLLKTTAIQVGWNGVQPSLAIVTPNILDVVADEPELPSRIVVTYPGASASATVYADWTESSFIRRDWRGFALFDQGNSDGVNPYRLLPFVPLFDSAPDDAFFLPGGDDIIEAQRAINVALANLWRAIELQSHGQAWAKGLAGGEVLRAGPDRTIALPTDGAFGFAAPNTPIEDVLKAIEFLIKQTAVANDLAANVFELDAKAESAAAKNAENRDLIEARQDDLDLWRLYETRLFEVLKRVVNTHRPNSIPEAATLSVDFGEIGEELSERDRLEAYRRRMEMGLWSPVDALMADNPDIRDRALALQTLQERREEAAVLGAPFAAPAFQGLSR